MCGIIGAFNYHKSNKTVNDDIENQFQDQRNRGTEGFGSVFLDNEHKITIKRATHEVKAMVDLAQNPSKMVIMHHRNPTSSENRILQTHPILVENKEVLKYKYLVIHNGIITNADELKKIHEDEGFKYTTFIEKKDEKDKFEYNDSEALAIEVARYIENSKVKDSKIVAEIRTSGPAAFIALQIDVKTDKVKKVYFGRNAYNPLLIKTTKAQVRISSEEDGGTDIKPNALYSFGLEKFNLKKKPLRFKQETYSGHRRYGTEYGTEYGTACNNDYEETDEFGRTADPHYGLTNIGKNETLADKQEEAIEEIKDELETTITETIDKFKDKISDAKEAFTVDPKDWMMPMMRAMHIAQRGCEEVHALVAYEEDKDESKKKDTKQAKQILPFKYPEEKETIKNAQDKILT